MAKKSFLNTGKPAGQAEKKVPAVPTSYSTSWREEEELVGRGPTNLSPTVEELSEPENRLLTPEQGPTYNSPPEDDFGANPAEDAAMAGQKLRRNFQEEEEQRRKAAKDDSAAPPRGGGKSAIPGKRDEIVTNLPISTLEGSKSNEDPDGGRFVAIRGTGSNAPVSADGHNPRPS